MTVSNWEKGIFIPTSQNVLQVAMALNFPAAWFQQEELELVNEYALSFRCQSRMSARLRNQSARIWDMAVVVASKFRNEFNLPVVSVPDYSDSAIDPESAAAMLRDELRLGTDPIDSMIATLESMGIMVFWTDIDSRTVDAYCHWDDNSPIVVLNTNQRSGERSRFNAAHELGHLVLHRESIYRQHFEDIEGPDPIDGETRQIREQEANAFASAFLLPEISYGEDAPFQPEPNDFLELKSKWKVSVAAMIRRSLELGYFSSDQYERIMRKIAIRGWRSEEPDPCPNEESIIHRQILEAFLEEDKTADDLAQQLHLGVADLCSLIPLASDFTNIKRQLKTSSRQQGKILDFPTNRAA